MSFGRCLNFGVLAKSLIYNVPDEHFAGNHDEAVLSVLRYLWKTPVAGFVCQNGQHDLFGDTEEQWKLEHANETIAAFVKLWDSWYQ